MPFRILCADSSAIAQRGIDSLCRQHAHCRIDRFVSSRTELRQALAEEHFDVLVADSRLENVDFMADAFDIRCQMKDLRMLLFAEYRSSTLVARAVAYECYDVVFRDSPGSEFIESLQSLEQGRPPERSVLVQFRSSMTRTEWPAIPKFPFLTKRETQIVALLGLGLSNREVSLTLGIGIETTKEHMRNILRKTKQPDRTAVAVWGLKQPSLAACLPILEPAPSWVSSSA